MSNFHQRLKNARRDLHLTQEAIAARWGYDRNYIYMLESGQKNFPKKLEERVLDLEYEVRQKKEERAARDVKVSKPESPASVTKILNYLPRGQLIQMLAHLPTELSADGNAEDEDILRNIEAIVFELRRRRLEDGSASESPTTVNRDDPQDHSPLGNQTINTHETIQGVPKEIADIARAAAPVAVAKVLRESREHPPKGKAASPSGSKGGPTSGAGRTPSK